MKNTINNRIKSTMTGKISQSKIARNVGGLNGRPSRQN
jgi:hypothetical protein